MKTEILLGRTVLSAFALSLFFVGGLAVNAQSNMTSGDKPAAMKMSEKSLYDRLGGEAAISAVIDDFVGRVAADDRINKKFARSDIERVKFHLKEQVCAATGGPCQYTGLSMKESHKNMKVTEGEFNALVEDLVATLDKFNVPAAEKNELLGILGPLKSQIVEVNSKATGTALPADFKPAPPLKEGKKKSMKKSGMKRKK